MNKEDLMIKAAMCTDKKQRALMVEDIYFANIGLTVSMMKEMCGCERYYDDFLQTAFIALYKACEAYAGNRQYSALAYYRMCLRHESYHMWLKAGGASKEVSLTDSLNTGKSNNKKYKEMYERVEQDFMDVFLWTRVSELLCASDVVIIRKRFCERRTLTSLGKEYGVTAEAIRQRIIKLCKQLRRDDGIMDVATYYHYL